MVKVDATSSVWTKATTTNLCAACHLMYKHWRLSNIVGLAAKIKMLATSYLVFQIATPKKIFLMLSIFRTYTMKYARIRMKILEFSVIYLHRLCLEAPTAQMLMIHKTTNCSGCFQ